MRPIRFALAFLWILVPVSAAAQAPTPEALAEGIASAFTAGDVDAFDAVFPFEPGREFLRWARVEDRSPRMDLARVVRRSGGRAVLALGGYAAFGNTGSETIVAGDVWGLFEAVRGDGGWRLDRPVGLDRANRILAHALDVTIRPGRGLEVTDSVDVVVGDSAGFAARLVHSAEIESLTLDGEPAPWAFGGGLLWVDAQPAGRARIVLSYAVDVARDSTADPNSGRFEADYGHVRNQYVWHPFFDFQSGADQADFRIVVRAPEDVRIATDLPQDEELADGLRVVRARTIAPTEALTLWYDRDWRPREVRAGGARLVAFTTPDFRPPVDTLVAAFEAAHRVLAREYGEPRSAYLAIVQGRARPGAGWSFRSNEAIATPENGGDPIRPPPAPRAFFGHEVAHGWTRPTGAGANFLREGWATFAEAAILEDALGADAAAAFWESQRNRYETGGFEGRQTILDDPHNSGVAYAKGAWILRMLRDRMGAEAFARGLRAYVALPDGAPAGVEALEAALTTAWGRDVRPFLRPWLEEATIPDLEATLEDGAVILERSGPDFRLPLELEVETPEGPIRRTVEVEGPRTRIEVPPSARDVLVDPDHRLLLARHRGERVRFTVHAPDAEAVALVGDFTTHPIEARRDGEAWSVTVPLTAGTYAVGWRIDGERSGPMEARTVGPVERLENAYPRGSGAASSTGD